MTTTSGPAARSARYIAVFEVALRLGRALPFIAPALQHRQNHRFAQAFRLQRQQLIGVEPKDRFVAIDHRQNHPIADTSA